MTDALQRFARRPGCGAFGMPRACGPDAPLAPALFGVLRRSRPEVFAAMSEGELAAAGEALALADALALDAERQGFVAALIEPADMTLAEAAAALKAKQEKRRGQKEGRAGSGKESEIEDEEKPARVLEPMPFPKAALERLIETGALRVHQPGEAPAAAGEAKPGMPVKSFIPFTPFVLDWTDASQKTARLYTARSHAEESSVARMIVERLRGGGHPNERLNEGRVEARLAAFRRIAQANPQLISAEQAAAVEQAARSPFAVVTGGPGTGKTTSVANLLSLFLPDSPADVKDEAELAAFLRAAPRIKLAAPTGKAAARLMESLAGAVSPERLAAMPHLRPLRRLLDAGRIPSRTIHRWLAERGADGRAPGPDHPIEADVFIVDEASMMDAHLAHALCSALAPETRVILLGDADQLAAVGPGAVFAELTSPRAERAFEAIARQTGGSPALVRLTQSHRFPADSAIGELAAAIREGRAEALERADLFIDAEEADRARKAEASQAAPAPSSSLSSSGIRVEWLRFPEPPGEKAEQSAKKAFGKAEEDALKASIAWAKRQFGPYAEALKAYLEAHLAASPEASGNAGAGRSGLDGLEAAWARLAKAALSVRLLCASRQGGLGVEALNDAIEDLILDRLKNFADRAEKAAGREPADPGLSRHDRLDRLSKAVEKAAAARAPKKRRGSRSGAGQGGGLSLLYPGRLVIARSNSSALGVANGDVGILVPDAAGLPSLVRFLDSGRTLPLLLIGAHDTAYAMTIHQSQGSEFGTVGVFMPERADSPLAVRELLYTGVTRAKALVRLFGRPSVVEAAVRRPAVRASGLAARLEELAAAKSE